MLSKPRILSLSQTCLIDSIKYEHSCKILYVCYVKILSQEHDLRTSVINRVILPFQESFIFPKLPIAKINYS